MAPSIIVDDAFLASNGNLHGPQSQWVVQRERESAFNSTFSVCRTNFAASGSTSGAGPYIDLDFYGTEITLIGTPTANIAANYTIDGSIIRPATLNTGKEWVGKSGVKLWSLTGLSQTYHLAKIYPVSREFTFDYVLYKPYQRSGFSRLAMVLDDQDERINYTGDWSGRNGVAFPSGAPMDETISQTNTQNSSFTVYFTGANIGVYGALNHAAGKLSATYVIDKGTPTVITHLNGSQAVDPNLWSLHRQLFWRDLPSGTHTLEVTVNEVTGDQGLYLDYVTFEGTSKTTLSEPSPAAATSSTSDDSRSSTRYGIIGIVLAIIFALIISASWLRRRNRMRVLIAAQNARLSRQQQSNNYDYPTGHMPEQPWQPYPDGNNHWSPPAPPYMPARQPPPQPWESQQTPISPLPPVHQDPPVWQPPPTHALQSPPPFMEFPAPPVNRDTPSQPSPTFPQASTALLPETGQGQSQSQPLGSQTAQSSNSPPSPQPVPVPPALAEPGASIRPHESASPHPPRPQASRNEAIAPGEQPPPYTPA